MISNIKYKNKENCKYRYSERNRNCERVALSAACKIERQHFARPIDAEPYGEKPNRAGDDVMRRH